ncbi:uncharacterized protein wrm1 [Venturia canescens]|uniref:uncharacterized protein wrm1 n=1 Tax=Venturia canescens TaxID=32260 RepID=UPI001C9BD7D3|nr:uncharacterized protein LOC122417655 [Venturia canescens]
MSVLDDQELYKNNTYFVKHEPGDFTPFYVAITICSVLGGFLFILNIFFCWCSPYRQYWQDRHTGNRWIQSLWVSLPHKLPPLDLSELKPSSIPQQTHYPDSRLYYPHPEVTDEEAHYPHVAAQNAQEYMELHKRESDI